MDLPIDRLVIDPCNVRGESVPLGDLEESIRLYGVLSPAIVRPLDDGDHSIVFGTRRFLASRNLGKMTLPCIIRKMDDEEAKILSLTENVQREKLPLEEEAQAVGDLYVLYKSRKKGQRKVANVLGKSRLWVRQRLQAVKVIAWFREFAPAGHHDAQLPQDAETLSILVRAAKRLYPDEVGPRVAFIEGLKDKTRAEVRERVKALLSKENPKTRSLTLSTEDLPPNIFDLLDEVAKENRVIVRKVVARMIVADFHETGAITDKEFQDCFRGLRLPRKRIRFPVRS